MKTYLKTCKECKWWVKDGLMGVSECWRYANGERARSYNSCDKFVPKKGKKK